MTSEQRQIEVCKAFLLCGNELHGCNISENEYAVSPDGIKVFVFANNEIFLYKSRIKESKFQNLFADNENDTLLTCTKELIEYDGKKTAYKFTGLPQPIYIDKKTVKMFTDCKLYAYNATSRIIARDNFGRAVGLLMPVRVKDEL